eukprot:scaffold5708_cov378-Prasinococcus_capsulatus_cf.AAC.5
MSFGPPRDTVPPHTRSLAATLSNSGRRHTYRSPSHHLRTPFRRAGPHPHRAARERPQQRPLQAPLPREGRHRPTPTFPCADLRALCRRHRSAPPTSRSFPDGSAQQHPPRRRVRAHEDGNRRWLLK